jgi:hypothetical protein
MSSARDERRRPDGAGRAPSPQPDRPDADAPEFFLAVFQGGFREARIYRAYPDPDGVSFVYAGPAVAFLDLEVARGGGRGGWKVKAADSLKAGLVSAAGAALVGAGVLIAIVGRLAVRDGAGATDLIGMLLAFGAVAAVAIVVALTTAVRRITRRVAALDAMSREQIRAEAEGEKRGFRATADSVRDVRIDAHDREGGGRPGSAARLSFRHDPTGKWTLSLLTPKDARAAARAFRQLLGKDGVEVTIRLPRE